MTPRPATTLMIEFPPRCTFPDDARIPIFVESWTNEEAWRAHMQGAAIKRFRMSGAPNLIADFRLHRLAPVLDERSEQAA